MNLQRTKTWEEMSRMTELQQMQIIELRKNGLGYGKIAKELGLGKECVKSFCRRNGYSGFGSEILIAQEDRCRNCGNMLIQKPATKRRRFCCDTCRRTWWNSHPFAVNRKALYNFTCQNCGTEFTAYGNSHRKYCCHSCYIKARFGE